MRHAHPGISFLDRRALPAVSGRSSWPIEPRPGWPVPLRLDHSMVDFGRRGFATDDRAMRLHLESRAGAFLDGFNLASSSWPDPHTALASIAAPVRGFAYEGAGLSARLAGIWSNDRDRYLSLLAAGPGARYIHLIHVGFGWVPPLPGVASRPRLPGSGLLRWLAVDGAGFSQTFFGKERALRRLERRAESGAGQVALNGAGRALWFVLCGRSESIARRIALAPAEARNPLWAGVGLASGYAGGTSAGVAEELLERAADGARHLAQGIAFAATALSLAGEVPRRVDDLAVRVFGVDADTVAGLVDEAAVGLVHRPDVDAYQQWRSRIRAEVVC